MIIVIKVIGMVFVKMNVVLFVEFVLWIIILFSVGVLINDLIVIILIVIISVILILLIIIDKDNGNFIIFNIWFFVIFIFLLVFLIFLLIFIILV